MKPEGRLDCQWVRPERGEKGVSLREQGIDRFSFGKGGEGSFQTTFSGQTYKWDEEALADLPATVTGEIPRLDVLVLVLGEEGQGLAGQLALADIRGRGVHDAGGLADHALPGRGRRERDADGAGGALRDDALGHDLCQGRFDFADAGNVGRGRAGVVEGVCGVDVPKPGDVFGVEQLDRVGNQLLDGEDVIRRAEGKREEEDEDERAEQ